MLARVCERRAASEDAVTLALRMPQRWPKARAGQHIDISVDIDGVRHTRAYSLSAPPSDPRHTEKDARRAGRLNRPIQISSTVV